MSPPPPAFTRQQYALVFERERAVEYPLIDAYEQRLGFAIDQTRLLDAARVLACPIKISPPNWQHGRVLYATVRHWLTRTRAPNGPVLTLDIGTAKGFSALCLRWALDDAGEPGHVISIDVIDPGERIRRNTVAECSGLITLAETLAPWPEAKRIEFRKQTGVNWLMGDQRRIDVAFVDGKHRHAVVRHEALLLAQRQRPGTLALFDDLQIPGVGQAVAEIDGYALERVEAKPDRRYAVGTRL